MAKPWFADQAICEEHRRLLARRCIMRRLIYVSRAAARIDTAQVEAIVTESVACNTTVGVTGMLWFDGVHFAQVLEGEQASVEATMDRIRRDPRHRDIEVVLDRPIGHRIFHRWAMLRADDSESATLSTSFLVGFARDLATGPGRRLYEIVLASG